MVQGYSATHLLLKCYSKKWHTKIVASHNITIGNSIMMITTSDTNDYDKTSTDIMRKYIYIYIWISYHW